MNFVLHPCPSIPDPLRHLVADENRTIFIRANGSVNSERTWSGHVKTVGKGSGEFAEIRSVDAVSFQQFVDMHNKLMSREVTSTEWHEEAAFASPCLLTNIRQHPVACPNGIACIVDRSSAVSTVDGIPTAKEVRIQFCGGCQVDKATDVILEDFFSKPRLLSLGWVFAVPAEPDEASLFNRQPLPRRLTYFKVTGIKPEPAEGCHVYRASTGHFTLKMDEGRANSRIPSLLEICNLTLLSLQSAGADQYDNWWPCTPPGLGKNMKTLQDALLPTFCSSYLPSKLQLPSNILLTGEAGSGKKTTVQACCRWLGVNLFEVDCMKLTGEISAAAEARLSIVFDKVKERSPCVLYLTHGEVLMRTKDQQEEDPRLASAFKRQVESLHRSNTKIAVIVSARKPSSLAPSLCQLFYLTVAMQPLTSSDRLAVLQYASRHHQLDSDVNLSAMAESLQGATLSDIYSLTGHAVQSGLSRVYRDRISIQDPSSASVASEHLTLTGDDWAAAMKSFQLLQAKELGAPKVPEVYWEDVGGLNDVRQEILDTIQLPLEHPELFSGGLKRSGILLFGPPGCGKTLLAKAVATECSLNFLSVKGPELLNMYVGQSEENVREVFAKARAASPCVIFFDELDALAPNRGRSGDSGGVADRIVSQLLTELDGVGTDCNVFVIGATNRPDLIEPALLRPGRFDCRVYVGVYRERKSQLAVLEALTRKYQFEPSVNLGEVVSSFHSYVSGADVAALCSEAMMLAIQRRIAQLEADVSGVSESDPVIVLQGDLMQAAKLLVPSVSADEIALYESMRSNR